MRTQWNPYHSLPASNLDYVCGTSRRSWHPLHGAPHASDLRIKEAKAGDL